MMTAAATAMTNAAWQSSQTAPFCQPPPAPALDGLLAGLLAGLVAGLLAGLLAGLVARWLVCWFWFPSWAGLLREPGF